MQKFATLLLLFFFACIAGFNDATAQELKNEVCFKQDTYIPGYTIKKRANTAVFQGNRKRKNYFEGWYFKMVSSDGSSIISIIPGISLSHNGEDKHAFIQIIDGKTASTSYHSYPIEAFTFSKTRFAIRIGDNYFSEDSISINIENDTTSIKGKVYMSDQVHLAKNNNKKLAIMGWYRFAPFMQCYHGVVSLNHSLQGSLLMHNETFDFNNGLGYIEKDWGKSMPSSWIWMQSNNFSSENTSFMLSLANIPWMGSSFTGFLGFFLNNGSAQRFGTYTHAKLELESSNSDTIKITITDKTYTYLIETYRNKAGVLKAPVKGSMDRRITESVDAKLILTVMDENAHVIFNDSTSIAGLETVGNIKTLMSRKKKLNRKH